MSEETSEYPIIEILPENLKIGNEIDGLMIAGVRKNELTTIISIKEKSIKFLVNFFRIFNIFYFVKKTLDLKYFIIYYFIIIY